ncbi:MAG: Tn7 transposase TnsA N-terminal domain-containing protein [Advenella sp.]
MKAPRQIITRSPHRRTGLIACPWLQPQAVGYESLLECNFVRIALLCPTLLAIRHQPPRLDLGEQGTYTPDFMLTFGQYEKYLVEVKPSVFLKKARAKLDAARNQVMQQGMDFLICTDEEIYKDDRHERAGQILRQARSQYTKDGERALLLKLESVFFPTSMEKIKEISGLASEQIMYLIGRRHLHLLPSLKTDFIFRLTGKENRDDIISPRAWLSHSAR